MAETRTRPEDWLTKNNIMRIEGWARDGLAMSDIAKKMGVARSTLYEYMDKLPDIADAIKRGREPVDFQVENAMLKRALGYTTVETVEEVHTDENGTPRKHVRKITKEVPPDVGAQIFWLKNRKPELWRDKKEITTNAALEKLDDLLKETRTYAGLEPEAEGILDQSE